MNAAEMAAKLNKLIADARGPGCTCVFPHIDWHRQPGGDLRCVVSHSVECMRFRNN